MTIQRCLLLLSAVCASLAPAQSAFDTPEGYYSPGGVHAGKNGAGVTVGSATDPNKISDALKAQATWDANPGETVGEYTIRKSLVPDSLVGPAADAVLPSANEADLSGKAGWDVKLTAAAVSADSGYSAAVASGAALIGSYISFAVSPNPNSQAAAMEIGAAMQAEFAQATAFGELSQRYARGARTLATNYEAPSANVDLSGESSRARIENGTPGAASASPAVTSGGSSGGGSGLLSADARQQLVSRGIDADAFAATVASGNFTPADLNRQLGAKTDFTPEELQAGKQIAYDSLSAAGVTPVGERGLASDELKREGGSFARSRDGGTRGKDDGPVERRVATTDRGTKRRVDGKRAKNAGEGEVGGGQTRSELMQLMASLLRRKREVQREAAGVVYELQGIGVLPSRHGQNIFQVAHRNYRSFQKWKQGMKPVTRRTVPTTTKVAQTN